MFSQTWTRPRRWIYLLHRWAGIFGCLLMTLWFVSGMVMLYVGYPKLTPWDRLQHLPTLEQQLPYLSPGQLTALDIGSVQRLVLQATDGRPRYVLQGADGKLAVVDALTGKVAGSLSTDAALRAAQVFLPGVPARYLGSINEDRWTHSRGFNQHRPLHMVQMDDADASLLYISSQTGEVILQAPLAQRRWNLVGAWLHWLYPLKNQPVDNVWSWTVIALSFVCVLLACSGILVGIWRWRFNGRYKSGSRSPYASGWMRWHHLLGLGFAAITLSWIFSGLMSMNPLSVFSANMSPNLAAYTGEVSDQMHLNIPPDALLRQLHLHGFEAVMLEWKVLDGQPFVLARDQADRKRLLLQDKKTLTILPQWPLARLQKAAQRLFPYPITSSMSLNDYDNYYYRRDPQAMMGDASRHLPVLRLTFADPGTSAVYIDVSTGEPVLSLDRAERTGRWLFSLLHSWDLAPMLRHPGWRTTVLLLLSLGGLALSVSAVVIGWRRLRRKLGGSDSKPRSP